jgi:toxin ParE1/3/4
VERLGAFPAIGRPGRVAGTRELVVSGTPYIVPYRVRGERVQIITVLHSAQRWPDRLPEA